MLDLILCIPTLNHFHFVTSFHTFVVIGWPRKSSCWMESKRASGAGTNAYRAHTAHTRRSSSRRGHCTPQWHSETVGWSCKVTNWLLKSKVLEHTNLTNGDSTQYQMVRYTDYEAARVKSASRLVGGIAASTLNLQDGISNMAGESSLQDLQLTIQLPPYFIIPDLSYLYFFHTFCWHRLNTNSWQMPSAVVHRTSYHTAAHWQKSKTA